MLIQPYVISHSKSWMCFCHIQWYMHDLLMLEHICLHCVYVYIVYMLVLESCKLVKSTHLLIRTSGNVHTTMLPHSNSGVRSAIFNGICTIWWCWNTYAYHISEHFRTHILIALSKGNLIDFEIEMIFPHEGFSSVITGLRRESNIENIFIALYKEI